MIVAGSGATSVAAEGNSLFQGTCLARSLLSELVPDEMVVSGHVTCEKLAGDVHASEQRMSGTEVSRGSGHEVLKRAIQAKAKRAIWFR